MSLLHVAQWSKRARLLAVSAALLSAVGCDDSNAAADGVAPPDAVAAPKPTLEGDTGTLAFDLTAAADVRFNEFDYAITGPNFARAGSIDVSNSATVSARIDGLPAGNGYSITLNGTSVGEPIAQCSGSGSFDISARTVVNLPITISCHVERTETPPPTGAVAAPLPPLSVWLCGLALLLLGLKLTPRSRSKAAV